MDFYHTDSMLCGEINNVPSRVTNSSSSMRLAKGKKLLLLLHANHGSSLGQK